MQRLRDNIIDIQSDLLWELQCWAIMHSNNVPHTNCFTLRVCCGNTNDHSTIVTTVEIYQPHFIELPRLAVCIHAFQIELEPQNTAGHCIGFEGLIQKGAVMKHPEAML